MKIQDYPFKPNCPPEAIETAKKWLVDNQPKFGSLANFVKVSTSHKLVDGSLVKPCHAAIESINDGSKTSKWKDWDCVASEIAVRRMCKNKPQECTPDLYRNYVKWLVTESHYSRFILNRDDLDFCFDYGIVISSDIPTAVVQNILISSRYVAECHPASFKLFNRLYEAGYPGSVAYSIAFHSQMSMMGSAADVKEGDDPLMYGKQGHRAHPFWNSLSAFQRFVEGEFGETLVVGTNFRSEPSIYGGMKFCDDTGASTFIAEYLRKHEEVRISLAKKRGETYVYKIPQPFKKVRQMFGQKPSPSPDIVKLSELEEIILPHMKEKGVFSNAVC